MMMIWTIIDDDKVGDFANRGQGGNIMLKMTMLVG